MLTLVENPLVSRVDVYTWSPRADDDIHAPSTGRDATRQVSTTRWCREQLGFGLGSIGYFVVVRAEPAPSTRAVSVGDTADIRAARNLVADHAIDLVGADRAEDIRLVVSELVTNALEHGDGGDAVVEFGVDDGVFVVSVTAASSALPDQTVRTVSQDQTTGRGLQIVAHLTESMVVSGQERNVAVTCRFALAEV